MQILFLSQTMTKRFGLLSHCIGGIDFVLAIDVCAVQLIGLNRVNLLSFYS